MTWQGLVGYAARVVRLDSARREPKRSEKQTGSHGPAQITEPRLRRNGLPIPDLTARAHRLHNRKIASARRYLRTHEILAKGNCSDGQTS